MPTLREIPRGSSERIYADMVSEDDISSATVAVAIHREAPTVWLPAVWHEVGVVKTTDPVTFNKILYPQRLYDVTVRVTANGENILVPVGQIELTG